MPKSVHSLKNQCFHAHILSKYVYSLKNKWFSCNFFKFCMKNPLVVMSKFGKKTSILAKLHCLWANKVNSLPFFPLFSRKSNALMPIFCQKNVKFLKNTLLSSTYYVKKKTSILSKTRCSHVFFFKLNKKIHAVMPIFG